LDDSKEVPKPNRVVGGLIPDCEIIFLPNEKLATWSSASFVPKEFKLKKTRKITWDELTTNQERTWFQ
jgi:hypothetical protein